MIEEDIANPKKKVDIIPAINLKGVSGSSLELPKETPEEVRAALKTLEKSLNKGWTEKNQSIAEQSKGPVRP